MNRSHTKNAERNDANALAEEARALLEATAELTDKKIIEARDRLADALRSGKHTYMYFQDKAIQGVKAANQTVRDHPYESMILALGVGALVGFLLGRREFLLNRP